MRPQYLKHIGVTYPDIFPDKIIELHRNEIEAEGLQVLVRKAPFGGPYASFEWAIPTAICVCVLKPYFDGFLKEMGKDHYVVLKNWLNKVSVGSRSIQVTTHAAPQSTEKLDKSNTQSKVFSIETVTNEGHHLKFLFDESLSDDQWLLAIERALKLLDSHFQDNESDRVSEEIQRNSLAKWFYARINTSTLEWELVDNKLLYLEGNQHGSK